MNISSGYLKKMGYLVFVITIFTLWGCGVGSTVEGSNDTAGNDIIIEDIKTQTDSSVMDVQRDSEMKDIVNDVNDVEISDTTDDVAADRCIPNCTNKECGDDGCGGNCGSCGDNAVCNDNKCECISGFGNCNGNWNDGCEANFSTDPHHCSDCATDCGDNSVCNNKICNCQPGYGNCDGLWSNGCEKNLTNDGNNCGSCGNSCGNNGICVNSECDCISPYLNCNGLLSDGCEVNKNVDIYNCGGCGNICNLPNTSVNGCISGVCKVINCIYGYGNCDGLDDNGCETNLTNDAKNCGNCGYSCGSGSYCQNSNCVCNSGFGNCDNDWSNGCETNLSQDPHHCSDCATDCGDNSICNNKTCACQSGYFNCDGIWINGCEVNLNDPATCGKSCDSKVNCGPNSVCNNGVCGCQPGYANCDGLLSNGCEVDLNSVNSCGTNCSNKVVCSTNNGINPVCDNGVCRLTCNSGYEDCNAKAGSSDGCEVNLNSINSCGTNCSNIVKCSSANGSNPVCDNGLCVLSCNEGYQDCNYEYGKSDGCEVRLNSPATCGTNCWDIMNCGVYSVCKNGVCECQVGYANCDGDWNNGCEINMTNDENNCGGCNITCGIGEKCINSKCGKGYRRQISINNVSSTGLTNYQVSFTINTSELISAGKMRSDCGDIRLYDTDGTTELSYWVEDGCNSTSTKVWVKVPDIAANSTKIIYLQYGELDLTSKSNGDDVFLLFDDFIGASLDLNKFVLQNSAGGSVSILNSHITFNTKSSLNDYIWIHSVSKFRYPVWIEAKVDSIPSGTPTYRMGLSTSTNLKTKGNYYNSYSVDWYGMGSSLRVVGDNNSNGWIVKSISSIFKPGIWRFTWVSKGNQIGGDGVNSLMCSDASNEIDNYYAYFGIAADNNGSVVLDWVRVRQYISPEPNVTVGQED
jgi:hypothetical protein